ncbi:MAG TPA: calcium-binding protein [Thermoleophilaceae bacterium]|nr:calcium-binding protein [Thermoleophilaceae bacterium]
MIRAFRKSHGQLALGIAAALAGGLAVPAGADGAAISHSASGHLNVSLTLGSPAAIGCDGDGAVRVNGSHPTLPGLPVPCASLTVITVSSPDSDAGGNAIDLSGVTNAAFPALASTSIDGGGGDDTVAGSSVARGGDVIDAIDGGPGEDTLAGGPGSDSLAGGDGPDTLAESVSGIVVLTAGGLVAADGRDVIAHDLEAVSLAGSDGADRIDASAAGPVRVTLSGAGGDDVIVGPSVRGGLLSGGGGADMLTGGSGDDLLVGDDGPDLLDGGTGNDLLDGGAGADSLIGGPGEDSFEGSTGDDEVDARDGALDEAISCGDGADRATIDLQDTPAADCEVVLRPGDPDPGEPAPADADEVPATSSGGPLREALAPEEPRVTSEQVPADRRGPIIAVTRVRISRRGVVGVGLACDESCSGTYTVRTAGRVRIPAGRRRSRVLRVTLGSGHFGREGAKRLKLDFRLSRRTLAALRARRSTAALLTIAARDRSGNLSVARLRITFEPPGYPAARAR